MIRTEPKSFQHSNKFTIQSVWEASYRPKTIYRSAYLYGLPIPVLTGLGV